MQPTQQPTDIDYVKVAVVIDCEGNISINGSPKTRYYALQVTVGNTDFLLLEWCLARFGGAIYEIFYKRKRGSKYAPAKRWRIQNQEAADLLTKCLPHFIIKGRQAEIGVKFESTYNKRGERINESDSLRREELKQQLRAMTRRGPKPPPKAPLIIYEEGNLFAKLTENEEKNQDA